MWRDEKSDYLRRNRDYSSLLDGDNAEVQTPRGQSRGRSNSRQFAAEDGDLSPERQEYWNRRNKLKELERQKLTKGKNGLHSSGSRDDVPKGVEQKKNQGGSRSGGDLSLSKGKKKLPYDRSFGSFFGPSEPVVAKRIIEEARAREEAEIVAAREAKASVKAQQRKPVASLSAGKVSRESRRPKPEDKATEKIRKLKEARDYSFLLDDSPVPGPKVANSEGVARPDSSSVLANRHPGKIPSERLKSTLGSNGSTISSRPLQAQSKSSQPLKPSPRQGPLNSYPSDRSAIQHMSITNGSAKQVTSKVFSTGPGRPVSRKGTDLRKTAMARELAGGSTASNGNKSISADRSQQSSLVNDWNNFQILDTHPTQLKDRHPVQPSARQPARHSDRPPSQATERQPTRQTDRLLSRATERQPARQTDRLPSRPIERQPARQRDRLPSRSIERQPAQLTDRRPTQSVGRLPAQVKDSQSMKAKASERAPVTSQGLKKGAPTSATYRVAPGREEPRRQVLASQELKQKPSFKGAARPMLSNYTRARGSDEPRRGETWHKRPRGSSVELDEPPKRRNKLPDVCVNFVSRAGPVQSSSDRDDDFFIDDDDDDDLGNVSSMIHSIMGYNPNKYRGNDDFDDRSMEVGFQTIQAEERRSAREARLEDERELAKIEAEEREERLRKAKKKRNHTIR